MELLVPVHKISALRTAGPLSSSGTGIFSRLVPVCQRSHRGSCLYLQWPGTTGAISGLQPSHLASYPGAFRDDFLLSSSVLYSVSFAGQRARPPNIASAESTYVYFMFPHFD